MAEYLIQDTTLTNIADAIREKEGSTDVIDVNDMASRINALSSGGVDTCTVRFIPYSGTGFLGDIVPAQYDGIYMYTKCVDGVVSHEVYINQDDVTLEYNIILENVVCGSIIYFPTVANYVNDENANGGFVIDNGIGEITQIFVAPSNRGETCIFALGIQETDDGGW